MTDTAAVEIPRVNAPAIQIQRISAETIRVPLVGTAPLIVHNWDDKARRQMLDNMQGRKTPKQPKDPQADYEASLYRTTTGYGFPVIAFKAATVGAARFFGKSVRMTELRQFLFMTGEPSADRRQILTPIEGEPKMREDVVRVGMGTDLRHLRHDRPRPRQRPVADRRGRHGRRHRGVAPGEARPERHLPDRRDPRHHGGGGVSLRDQLKAIYAEQGKLTPQLVVDVARAEDHPLHSRFEWDDALAGEAYRRVQAQQLIRSVRIVHEAPAEQDETAVRAFHSVPRPDGPTYVPVEEVAEDEFSRELVLRQAEREWKQLYRRYSHLAEFLGIVRGDLAKGA